MFLAFLVFAFFGLAPACADDSITMAFFADVNGSLVPLSGETFELFNKKLRVFSYSEMSPAPAEFFLENEHYAGTSYELKRRVAGFVRGYFTFGYGLRNTYLEFDANQKVVNYPFYSCMDPHEHVNAIRYDIDPHEDCAPVDIYFYHYNRKTGAAVKHYVPEVKKGCEPTPGVVLPWRCYDYHPEPRVDDPNPGEEENIVEPEITSHSAPKPKSLTTPSSSESGRRDGSFVSSLPSLVKSSDGNTSTGYTDVPTSSERELEWYDSANATRKSSLMLGNPSGPKLTESLSGSHQSILPESVPPASFPSESVPPASNSSTQPESVQTYSHTDPARSSSLIVPKNSTQTNSSQEPIVVKALASSTLEAHAPRMSAESLWLQNTPIPEKNSTRYEQVCETIWSMSLWTSNVSALSAASSSVDGYSDPSGPSICASFHSGPKHTASDQPPVTLGATCHLSDWILQGTSSAVLPCSVGTNTLGRLNESTKRIDCLEKGPDSADATATCMTTLTGGQCNGCDSRSVVSSWNTYTDYTTSCSRETTLTITRCDSLCYPFTMTVTHATVLTVSGVCIVPDSTARANSGAATKSFENESNGLKVVEPSRTIAGQVPSPSASPIAPVQASDDIPNTVHKTAPASTSGTFSQTSHYASDTKTTLTGPETITPITNAAAKNGNAVWLLVLVAWL